MDPVVACTLRLALAALFAWAAGHKLREPRAFTASVRAYRLVPDACAGVVATGLVVAEVGTVVGLLLGPTVRAGAAAVVLLGLYAVAIAVNVVRGRRDLDCGCAGPAARRPVSEALVVRNVALAAVAALLLVPPTERAVSWLDLLTVGAATTALAVLYAVVEALLANRPAIARMRGLA